eukprot:TRINITY_DN11289_c0_g1_i1.p1 TRINITY_DN11289_c0_g1~~TRINITY_DN11289_c0_g1_i1.p1  ORF type:complete len:127 (+),score=27.51 TRINITY_DN11289_c0_g1_i1:160-540(+)
MCLAFIDEVNGKWECVDRDLIYEEDNDEEDVNGGGMRVTGRTSHFTSFAILVDSRFITTNNNKPPVQVNNDKTNNNEAAPFPLAVAIAVPLAGVVCVVAIISAWMYLQRKKRLAEMDKQIIQDQEL